MSQFLTVKDFHCLLTKRLDNQTSADNLFTQKSEIKFLLSQPITYAVCLYYIHPAFFSFKSTVRAIYFGLLQNISMFDITH